MNQNATKSRLFKMHSIGYKKDATTINRGRFLSGDLFKIPGKTTIWRYYRSKMIKMIISGNAGQAAVQVLSDGFTRSKITNNVSEILDRLFDPTLESIEIKNIEQIKINYKDLEFI